MSGLLRWKNNTRINGIVMKNNTIYAASYITTYIVPLVFIEMNLTGFVVSIVLFIVIGAIFIYSDKHLPNPTFFMFGYKTYEIDDKNILFQGSLDMLNIELIESPHGISARELTKNTYIVLPQ
jgi:hypothetical protein